MHHGFVFRGTRNGVRCPVTAKSQPGVSTTSTLSTASQPDGLPWIGGSWTGSVSDDEFCSSASSSGLFICLLRTWTESAAWHISGGSWPESCAATTTATIARRFVQETHIHDTIRDRGEYLRGDIGDQQTMSPSVAWFEKIPSGGRGTTSSVTASSSTRGIEFERGGDADAYRSR